MNDDALIHMRVSTARKGRWVRASRAAGMRLSDWIIQAVEAHMQQQLTSVVIPEDVNFAQLRLARDADGAVSFDWTPIERICAASRIPVELFREGPEDNVAGLLMTWYRTHRDGSGALDPVAEDLIAEAAAEDAAGQPYSHAPGRG